MMAVTLRTTEAPLPASTAQPPSTRQVVSGAAVFTIGNTTANNDDVHSPSWIAYTTAPAAPGVASTFATAVENPGGPDSTVRIIWQDRDPAGALLASGVGPNEVVAAGAGPRDISLALPAAAPGSTWRRVAISNRDTPPGNANRVNLFPDPQATTPSYFVNTSANWSAPVASTGASGVGVAGLTSYVRMNCTTAEAPTNRALYMYQDTIPANPTAGVGLPVTAGQTITISAYVYSTKAATLSIQARCFTGTTWSHAVVGSTGVAVSANTWTRLSYTFTVPAGATLMALRVITLAAVSWVAGDYLGVTGVLVEAAGSLAAFFSGSLANGLAGSVAWQGDANSSPSSYWTSTLANRRIILDNERISLAAAAEELVGVALERDLRRSVADIWSDAQALITAGTAGLLAGQLTLLCASLAQAMAVDSVYQGPGLVTLESTDELNGLSHRAVGRARLNPERALPGKPARWLYIIDFREQVS